MEGCSNRLGKVNLFWTFYKPKFRIRYIDINSGVGSPTPPPPAYTGLSYNVMKLHIL